jgi:hypothetical protein
VMNDQKKSGFIRKMALSRFHGPFTVFFLRFLTLTIVKEYIKIIILYTPTHFLYAINSI